MLVPFPFTDLKGKKIRPAIIISKKNLTKDNVIVVFVSSQKTEINPKALFRIKKSDPTFSETGLKFDSVVRCDKIASLDKKIVLGEIGKLDKAQIQKLNQKLKNILDI